MSITALVLGSALAASVQLPGPPSSDQLEAMNYEYSFEQYTAHFNKKYDVEMVDERRAIFAENLATIRSHNAKKLEWTMGVNEFTDMTSEEFKGQKLGYSKALGRINAAPECKPLPKTKLPESVDWRTKGVVTPVKNQEACGSCWAFSTAETVESHLAILTGTLDVLAPQEFVDCVKNPNQCGGTGGCEGATQWLGFQYAMEAGVATEKSYPYKGRDETCDTKAMDIVGNISGYCRLPHVSGNFTADQQYSELMQSVSQLGPIAISAAAEPWQMYERGVFSSKMCGTDVDHAIQLVGYGTESGVLGKSDYWLVRNSWGAGWGEDGYIRIKRYGSTGEEPCAEDKTPGDGTACKGSPAELKVCGECGIMSDSSYPTGGHIF
eukprot:CAMPEP_0182924536 /NCGR_PEP_ID=MMETSP0105_2-20130417/6539_1 /TAXON_ID=81532 ORGANISM="Acanthoeca-like sp., Strain 10tr" /NCGR_SAMPLE_ID=MMETSP0105_2 /ASSEMBLY_ACC=CAM_ASM_000205 /LENGTH=379 /DNA_ID=CAMNT_0025062325 /DNA_START=13 /DNA_END=1152 /DNA_ORIENTATION=+